MPENRLQQTSVAVPPSPTGAPVVPPSVVPWLVGLVGIAGVLAQVLPSHTIGAKVASGVFALGGLFGLVSPGLRR